MIRKQTGGALAALSIMAGAAYSEETKMKNLLTRPEQTEPIVFTDFSHAIQGRNAGVPRVRKDSVLAFGDSFGTDFVYLGWVEHGQLVRLETWERIVTDAKLPSGTLLGGLPVEAWTLKEGEVHVFTSASSDNSAWTEVAPGTLTGEASFLRLRTLPGLSGAAHDTVAEFVEQSLAAVAIYEFDSRGGLTRIVHAAREKGFAAEVTDMPVR